MRKKYLVTSGSIKAVFEKREQAVRSLEITFFKVGPIIIKDNKATVNGQPAGTIEEVEVWNEAVHL